MSCRLTLPQNAFYTYALRPAALNGNYTSSAYADTILFYIMCIYKCFWCCLWCVLPVVHYATAIAYIFFHNQHNHKTATSYCGQHSNIPLASCHKHFLSSRPSQPINTVYLIHKWYFDISLACNSNWSGTLKQSFMKL